MEENGIDKYHIQKFEVKDINDFQEKSHPIGFPVEKLREKWTRNART